MTTAQFLIIATIIIYLGAMMIIGFYFNRKGSGANSGEFYLGGRGLGPIVTAMSAEASDMSSWLLMGLPGLAYFSGIAEPAWTAIGLAVGTYFNWLIVAKRLRRYSSNIGAITIPEFFTKRYRDQKRLLSLAAALIILIFFIPYTASGFKAVGSLFNSLFGVDYHIAMIFGAIVIITYTVLGGFLAVSTTDLVQSIFMTIALIVIVFFGISRAGGMGTVMENARALPGYLNIMQGYVAADGTAGSYNMLSVFSTLAWGLGYFGMPHILLRFMAIRKESELTLSRRIASVWVVISMCVAILIGIIGYSVSKAGQIPFFTTNPDAETVIVKLADLLSQNGIFLAIVAGIILAGILAATMSTADSQLLAASSSMSQDIVQTFFGVKMDEKKNMRIARFTVIIIALIALILAWNPNSSVFRVVSFAWAGFGAAFGPTMLIALFWKRSNRQGALAGIIVGGVMIFVWKFLISPLGGAWSIYELLPAFIIGGAANIIVCLLTPAPEKEIVEEFEKASIK